MKKERARKFIPLFLLALVLSVSLLSLVSAQSGTSGREIVGGIFGPLSNGAKQFFTSIFGTTLTGESIWELAVTKFLLMLLIFSIIYGVSDFFILEDTKAKTWLKVLFSAVIAYLSVIYLAPGEVYAALVGWGAMAVAITAVIPFAAIAALSWKLASNPNPAKMLVQKLLIAIFSVYLFVRVFALWWYKPANVWGFALPIYFVVLIVTVLMLIFNRPIQRFILTTKVSGYIEISDALNKEEALAEVIMLRDKVIALEKTGATAEAARLRAAATNLENVAKRKFK